MRRLRVSRKPRPIVRGFSWIHSVFCYAEQGFELVGLSSPVPFPKVVRVLNSHLRWPASGPAKDLTGKPKRTRGSA